MVISDKLHLKPERYLHFFITPSTKNLWPISLTNGRQHYIPSTNPLAQNVSTVVPNTHKIYIILHLLEMHYSERRSTTHPVGMDIHAKLLEIHFSHIVGFYTKPDTFHTGISMTKYDKRNNPHPPQTGSKLIFS